MSLLATIAFDSRLYIGGPLMRCLHQGRCLTSCSGVTAGGAQRTRCSAGATCKAKVLSCGFDLGTLILEIIQHFHIRDYIPILSPIAQMKKIEIGIDLENHLKTLLIIHVTESQHQI